ncbi:hypothetical protein Hokovirus_1_166 [Hokovirus HKV1]|uniref:Uncharacterized protein n=1 Tax=Hokovirus HKV1 TaxID=1977638 RepID=A0A1V0SEY6_9VIRU|nr:hypothetical protein Hokovirus_1_166 [Hokovirus HKV1]
MVKINKMLSKDKNKDKNKGKDKTKNKNKDKDKTKNKTKNKTKDKNKNITKINDEYKIKEYKNNKISINADIFLKGNGIKQKINGASISFNWHRIEKLK